MRDEIAFVEITMQTNTVQRTKKYKFFINIECAQKYADAYFNDNFSWVSGVGLCAVCDNGNIVPILESEEE